MGSLFGGGGLGSLASFAARPATPPDPATEMQRLLNQHATQLLNLENETAAIRGKQVLALGNDRGVLGASEIERRRGPRAPTKQLPRDQHPPTLVLLSCFPFLQEAAQGTHAEAAKALADAKQLLLRTEAEAAAAEAEAERRGGDAEAKALAAGVLAVQAEEAKKALKQAHALADQMRKSFLEEVRKVTQELRWGWGLRAWGREESGRRQPLAPTPHSVCTQQTRLHLSTR